ncbi:MAG TPA: hypothetical protein VFL57_09040 [Bryobacteraceae bacterium]|nr:hypothetical protein [Bryobacteraceae bacterium]
MPRIINLAGFSMLAVACASAAPEIRSILNGASYALPGTPGSAIAQGSIFVIFGTELGPAALEQAAGFPLPTTLGGTSVRITSGSVSLDAPLLYVSERQVAGILPSPAPVGIGLVAVTYDGRTSQSGAFRIVRTSPGILAQNQAGSGAALAQNINSAVDQPRNTISRPARPGQMATLWVTGLGPVPEPDGAQPTPRDLDVDLEVLVGGRPAAVRYKGRSPCCAGADQINFEVPRDVEGCYVPVVVRAGGAISNFTTISVARPGTDCVDVSGITGPEIERLQTGGDLRLGAITLTAAKPTEWSGDVPGFYEYGNGEFFQYDWNILNARLGIGRPPPGSCLVSLRPQNPAGFGRRPTGLDAGAALNLSGPKGSRQIPRRAPGTYSESFSSGAAQLQYLEPGNYIVDNGSGGADVGQFRATFTIPPELTTTIQRAAIGITVSWRGGDPAGLLTISGSGQDSFGPSPFFTCTERVAAGRFTVPDYVLASVPANLSINVAAVPGSSPQARFRAPGVDVGYILFSSIEY